MSSVCLYQHTVLSNIQPIIIYLSRLSSVNTGPEADLADKAFLVPALELCMALNSLTN